MIVVSNTTEQTLAPGQAMTFDNVVWQSPSRCNNRNEFFREGGSNVRIAPGVYDLSFTGNIGATTGSTAVQLALAVDGSVAPTTTMISTPTTANTEFNNVHGETIYGIPPITGGGSVTVVNNGTSDVIVAPNSALKVVRRG